MPLIDLQTNLKNLRFGNDRPGYGSSGLPYIQTIMPDTPNATGTVQLLEVNLHKGWYGEAVSLIEKNTDARVAFITRLGEALLPHEHTVLQEGDLVHVFAQEKKIAAIEKSLSKSPEGA